MQTTRGEKSKCEVTLPRSGSRAHSLRMRPVVRAPIVCVTILLLFGSGPVRAAQIIWPPVTTPPQINITSDSSPGWLPSKEQIAEVRKTTEQFLDAKDGGRSSEAYSFLADANKRNLAFGAFADAVLSFNRKAGTVEERRIVAVTWTKDPAQSPSPGVYAALDIVSRFTNIDRHCGFLILYQSPSGGAFHVMREEDSFLENATAKKIAQQHSEADVDLAWSKLAASCPNYPAALLPPLPEELHSSVGYPTVAAALQGLHANSGIKFSSQGGWLIALDAATSTIWSFAPAGNPAYPAVVKRQIVQDGTASNLNMNVLCESTKQACDNLVRDFERLNAQMAGSLKR